MNIGPEKPTLIERFVMLLHLPYTVGCLLVVVLAFLVSLTQTSLASLLLPSGLLAAIVGGMFELYLLYTPRYMRRKVRTTELSIMELLPEGEQQFHKLFGRISATRPQLLLFVSFALIFAFSAPNPLEITAAGVVFLVIICLGTASLLWAYFSILWGIHKLGAVPLNLRPYYTDPLLGLRPVGSLALSLAAVFLGAISLALLSSITYPGTGLIGYLALGGLVLLGLSFFFLPLMRLHRRMLLQKRLERGKIGEKLAGIFQNGGEPGRRAPLEEMFRLDMMERRISTIGPWPFDLQILGRLLVISLSVSTVLLARIIAFYLKIVIPLG